MMKIELYERVKGWFDIDKKELWNIDEIVEDGLDVFEDSEMREMLKWVKEEIVVIERVLEKVKDVERMYENELVKRRE